MLIVDLIDCDFGKRKQKLIYHCTYMYFVILVVDETITLSATPSKLEVSGSWVSVKWHGVPDPNSRDLVAVYSPTDGIPGNIDPSKHYAIKYIVS